MVFGLIFQQEAKTVGYKCRVAPDTAITGNRANDTPVQSQVERDNTVATNEGGCVRTTQGRETRGAGTLPAA